MATTDHTAHAGLSEPFCPLGRSRKRMSPAKAERHARLTKIAETALAVHVIQKLLGDSEAFNRAKAAGAPPGAHLRPLNSMQVEGLHAALRVLREQYDELLKAEGFD